MMTRMLSSVTIRSIVTRMLIAAWVGALFLNTPTARAQFGPFGPPYPPVSPWLPPSGIYPVPVPVPVPDPLPRSIRIASELIPDPPLPPARLELVNSSRDPLRVEIIDLRRGQVIAQHDIDPAASVAVELARDAGGEAIETYRTYGPWGDVSDREVVRRVPPEVRYELVVHRWQMQSIAIDRTGKSPSPIEDIQFAGQGIGRFRLPAGEQLIDGRIDVYQAARGAANPGSVAPIFPVDDDAGRRDPLREALESIRN